MWRHKCVVQSGERRAAVHGGKVVSKGLQPLGGKTWAFGHLSY